MQKMDVVTRGLTQTTCLSAIKLLLRREVQLSAADRLFAMMVPLDNASDSALHFFQNPAYHVKT